MVSIVNFETLTVGDCVEAYETRGMAAVINDGQVVDFVCDGE